MRLCPITAVWRSPRVPQVLTLVGLVLGVPLFLRSPPWCDVTLYDVAARNLLAGGVLYRDVFDTNPPGFVWALATVRTLFGSSYEALWGVDLAVFAGVVLLTDRLSAWGGATPAARWWVFAAASFTYPFWSEAVHGQRDVWLSLPALAAVVLRVRRATTPPGQDRPGVFGPAALDGALWGLAAWVKPHVLVLAAVGWLLTAPRLAGRAGERGADRLRAAVFDLLGTFSGGLAVGLAGAGFLVGTGAWPYFLDVFTTWNTHYARTMWAELDSRWQHALRWFPPWSLLLVPTVPLAAAAVGVGRVWAAAPRAGSDDTPRFARAVLGGMYLAWVVQSLLLQRTFQYAHVTETVLMLGVWAAYRWAVPALVFLAIAVTSTVWVASDARPEFRERLHSFYSAAGIDVYNLGHHPLTDGRLKWWPGCCRPELSPQEAAALKDSLRTIYGHQAAVSWGELEEVAAYLREKGAGDFEVVAWHDSPHAVYLLAGVRPGLRFMHVDMTMGMRPGATEAVCDELTRAAPRVRFAVSDLERARLGCPGLPRVGACDPGPSADDLLPPQLDGAHRQVFPYNQPTVFRSGGGRGRYIVHAVTRPVGECRIP